MQGARSRDERPPRSGSCCGPRLGNVRCAPNNGPWQHLGRKSQLSHFRTHAPQRRTVIWAAPAGSQRKYSPRDALRPYTASYKGSRALTIFGRRGTPQNGHLDALLEEVVSSSTASSAAAWVGSFRSISTRFLLGPLARDVGFTSMALGLMQALQRERIRVGFAPPNASPGPQSKPISTRTNAPAYPSLFRSPGCQVRVHRARTYPLAASSHHSVVAHHRGRWSQVWWQVSPPTSVPRPHNCRPW